MKYDHMLLHDETIKYLMRIAILAQHKSSTLSIKTQLSHSTTYAVLHIELSDHIALVIVNYPDPIHLQKILVKERPLILSDRNTHLQPHKLV